MLSSDWIDIREVRDMTQKVKSSRTDHFVILTIDGKKVFESTKARSEPAPQWNEQKAIRFTPASKLEFLVYRQSRIPGWRKHISAECSAQGMDFLEIEGAEQILVDKSGKPRLAVKLNLVPQSHPDFIKSVQEDVSRLAEIKGADTIQAATSIGANIGTALQAIVPVINQFSASHPILNGAWIVLSSAYRVRSALSRKHTVTQDSLKIAQHQKTQDDSVRDLVANLREMAGAASSYEEPREISGTINVIEEIGKVSLEAAVLVHDFVDPSIGGKSLFIARIAKHALSDMPSRITQCQKRCKELTESLKLRVALDTNAIMKDVHQNDKSQHSLLFVLLLVLSLVMGLILEGKIHEWMKSPDTSPNYNAARKAHQPGTGSWFLNGSQFSEWKEKPGSVIWLCGGPGCGKTVLCASIIDNVITFCQQKPLARGYAYFFFDGTRAQSETLDFEGLIRSIITQLSDRCDDQMPAALVKMYEACDRGHRRPLETQLESTLARILETFEHTYIIIDSLDECGRKDDLLKWIRSVAAETSTHLHFMFTSRPEPELELGLVSLSNLQKVSITGEATMDDIREYLDAWLAEMTTWDMLEKGAIKSALSDGSGGMFRWVSLQKEALKQCNNKRELKTQLKSLPKGLDDAYVQIFRRSKCPEYLQKLMQWLVFAEEPLTVAQLSEVLAVDFTTAELPFYDPELRCSKPEIIWEICNGLVTEIEGTIKLAHFSVKEYFIQRIKPEAEAQSSTSEEFSHFVIAQTCLAQILHLDGPNILDWKRPDNLDLNHVESSFPLARYAAMSWVTHFHSSGAATAQGPYLDQLILRLFPLPSTSWSHALLSWVRIQNLVIDTDYYCLQFEPNVLGRVLASCGRTRQLPLDASPLYYACFAGSVQAVRHLLSNSADVDRVGCEASSRPLLIASEEGHLEIARLLLHRGVNVNVEGGSYGTALQAACARGHLELAKLLLDNGADINIVGGRYGTALQAACAGGYLEFAQLLLVKGSDVNAVGGFFGTALQAACARGRLELTKLLLDNGADLNVVGGEYRTALQAAYTRNYCEIIKLLKARMAIELSENQKGAKGEEEEEDESDSDGGDINQIFFWEMSKSNTD
ncbi:hypothetical protein HWV62_36913 [Athelia sp. TMB]|nr:hypothetical protein HWV62_36913 [Athelia sp. TMB]